MTVIAASGDAGAAGCDPTALPASLGGQTGAKNRLAVLLPSTLPQFTAVGGTEFNEGAGTYWSASNGLNLGSALSYIPERAWNDTAALGELFAGGGGVSTLFVKPTWQAGTGVPNDGIATCPTSRSPRRRFPPRRTGLASTGPAARPLPRHPFAGIVALLVQANGGSFGNINPMLYDLAAQSPSSFHDVTVGDNIVPCKQGTTDCPAAAPFQYGYSAGPGYDLATGLGSVDAFNLVTAWLACDATLLRRDGRLRHLRCEPDLLGQRVRRRWLRQLVGIGRGIDQRGIDHLQLWNRLQIRHVQLRRHGRL